MRKQTYRRIGIIHDQEQGFRIRRRSLDPKRRINVLPVAAEFRRNVAAFLKS